MYPFSDEFTDYDLTRDKQIEYEEFVFSVMSKFPLNDPEELREPFVWADANGTNSFYCADTCTPIYIFDFYFYTEKLDFSGVYITLTWPCNILQHFTAVKMVIFR